MGGDGKCFDSPNNRGWNTFQKVKVDPIIEQIVMVGYITSRFASFFDEKNNPQSTKMECGTHPLKLNIGM